MLRRTPCIGICSTTYGDLVCRGCKRFAHEIVQWNGYDPQQRGIVWERLLELRAGAVRSVLAIRDAARLHQEARRAGLVDVAELTDENLLYELLQRLQWRETTPPLAALGIALADDSPAHPDVAPEALLARIDREFYLRSVARYEHSYRISAQ